MRLEHFYKCQQLDFVASLFLLDWLDGDGVDTVD